MTNDSEPRRRLLQLAPCALLAVYAVLLAWPTTRQAALASIRENHLVEWATFGLLMLGGAFGMYLALRPASHGYGSRSLERAFIASFALALLVVAMEEIAWGQYVFGPSDLAAEWRAANIQNETTLHNLPGLHGRSEILRLVFGVGGLIGILIGRHPRLASIRVAPFLWPWFALIVAHASLDVFNDFVPIEERFDWVVQRVSELIELVIAGAAVLYLWFLPRAEVESDEMS